MRITLSAEGKTVQLITSAREKVSLQDAEDSALRMLRALPAPQPDPEKQPIGFTGPVESDTDLAPDLDEEPLP